ncbi:hypothetical protein LQZ18_04215 [Lachnospiraceae bacterium ZAX-1]
MYKYGTGEGRSLNADTESQNEFDKYDTGKGRRPKIKGKGKARCFIDDGGNNV